MEALFEASAHRAGLDPTLAERVDVSLERNPGRTLTYKAIHADVFQEEPGGGDHADPTAFRKALEPYLSFFRDQYFMEERHGWDAPVKSRSRVRPKPKRGFADPSLGAALLSMTPKRLVMESQTFGTLFEEMCLRDVRVYASVLDSGRNRRYVIAVMPMAWKWTSWSSCRTANGALSRRSSGTRKSRRPKKACCA